MAGEAVGFTVKSIAFFQSQFILFLIGDRRLIGGSGEHFAIFGNAPPFLLIAVCRFAVYGGDKSAIDAVGAAC